MWFQNGKVSKVGILTSEYELSYGEWHSKLCNAEKNWTKVKDNLSAKIAVSPQNVNQLSLPFLCANQQYLRFYCSIERFFNGLFPLFYISFYQSSLVNLAQLYFSFAETSITLNLEINYSCEYVNI